MNPGTPFRSGRTGRPRRTRSVATALVAILAVALPASALAQDAAESPAAESPAVESSAPATSSGIDFPVMLGGQLLTAETFTGPEWLAQFSDGETEDATFIESTEALVESVGKTIDDLTVKMAIYRPSPGESIVTPDFAPDSTDGPDVIEDTVPVEPAVVAAFRIDGVDGREFVEDAVQLLLGDVAMPELVLRPLGLKWGLRVVDAERPGVYPRTVYFKDDIVWIIQGDEPYVWDALDQLPDPDPVGVMANDTLAGDVPLVLDGRRRTVLYEVTEPLALPTLYDRWGTDIEDWLQDLYLGTGISPAEMLGVIAWWGIQTPQESIQIEGYRLPEGGQEMLERLRTESFLGDGAIASRYAQLIEDVAQTEAEIAGHTVTTLDYGQVKQHIFSGADTLWVVTDHVGEPDMVEEAIAALP